MIITLKIEAKCRYSYLFLSMRTLLITVVFIFAVNISYSQFGAVKRALKHLEKGNFERSERLVAKALRKDSLLPAALYAKSHLLFNTLNKNPDLDSAYYYILTAQKWYSVLPEDGREDHLRSGADSLSMNKLKEKIDSAAFERAFQEYSEASFIHFINEFPTAEQVLRAESLRNAIAYAAARAENSHEGYEQFMDKYPDAVQVKEAKARYEKLYFETSTKNGKLKSYVDFLTGHPDTPYRYEIEAHIFKVLTANHSASSYRRFIRTYPDSKIKPKAVAYLYHILKEQNQQLPAKLLTDSLKEVKAMEGKALIPFWETGKYGFMTTEGEELIKPVFSKLKNQELCGSIHRDYVLMENAVAGLNQAVIYKGPYDEVQDLGYGFLKIAVNGKWGVIHKSGRKIAAINHENVALLQGRFIAFQTNGLWGLQTISGSVIVEPDFTSIWTQGPFFIFEKDDLFDIKNDAQLRKVIDNGPLTFSLRFNDLEWLEKEQLWLASPDGKEAIFDKNLRELIPFAHQKIMFNNSGFIVKKENGVSILDEAGKRLNQGLATKARYNDLWLAVADKEDQWALYNNQSNTLRYEKLDSIKLIGSTFALAFKNDSSAVLSRGRPILLGKEEKVSLISATQSEQYLVIDKAGQEKKLVNNIGRVVFTGSFEEAKPIGRNLIVLSEKGKKGLISASGEVLLQTTYDAIGNFDHGFVSLLRDQKFGLIDQEHSFLIPAAYDKNIKRYNDQVFIVERDNKRGLVDRGNNELMPLVYEEVRYWNDSVALVKEASFWSLYNFRDQQIVYGGIKTIHTINSNESEKVSLILKDSGYGILSNLRGEVISATYDDVINVGTQENPVYLAEKLIAEADFYVIIYYDKKGKVIRKQALDAKDYPSIYCEE